LIRSPPGFGRQSLPQVGAGRNLDAGYDAPGDRAPGTENRPQAPLQVLGFSDTDAQGIVYYGRYLPYFDLARVEYERHLGLLRKEAVGKDFVMRASSVVYEAPARFDDLLEVFVRIKRVGVTSVCYELCVNRVEDDLLMCTAEQTLVLVAVPERRPTPISDEYRRTVTAFEGADLELAVPVE
jgi:acyl-CoA thioester hydrolase